MYFYQLIVSSTENRVPGKKVQNCSQEQKFWYCPYSYRDVDPVETGEQYFIIITVKIHLFFFCSSLSTFMALYVTKLSFNVQREDGKKTPKTSDYFKPKSALCFYVRVSILWGCAGLVLRNFCFALIMPHSEFLLNIALGLHREATPVSSAWFTSLWAEK